MKMNRVFVLDSAKNPLMPCHTARARELLSAGKAAVFRTIPFTIVLKDRAGGDTQPIEFKVDPGSKAGLALVGAFKRGLTLIWAANLMKNAAAANATRYAIGDAVKKAFGLPTEFWSGGRTKFNRCQQGYPKDHFIDAACVGASGEKVWITAEFQALGIKVMGRGTRQTVRTDKHGFPRGGAGQVKRVYGFQTGDERLTQLKGKYAGVHIGRLSSIRASGTFDIQTDREVLRNPKPLKVSASYKNFNLIQRGGGYAFTLRAKNAG